MEQGTEIRLATISIRRCAFEDHKTRGDHRAPPIKAGPRRALDGGEISAGGPPPGTDPYFPRRFGDAPLEQDIRLTAKREVHFGARG